MGTLSRTLIKWEIVSGDLWGHYIRIASQRGPGQWDLPQKSGARKGINMISRIVAILRPTCVAATIGMSTILISSFWGWHIVGGDTLWKLLLSYGALMIASTLICYIDDPKKLTGR